MVPTVKNDFCVKRMNGETLVQNYGVHDGDRDGEEYAMKFYTSDLQVGETLVCEACTRTVISQHDVTEKARLEIQKAKHDTASAALQARIDAIV